MRARSLAYLLVCGFAFAACGSSSGDDSDAEAAIEKTIVTLAKTDDPADCRRLATARFHEVTGKSNYETALSICEEAAIDPLVEDAEKVTVSEIEVEGDSATAVAAYVGSGLDGQVVRLGMVERDGRWKQDELLGFVRFDAEKMVTELGREILLMAKTPREAESASCVVRRLGEISEGDLEELLLDDDPTPLLELGQSCASRSSSL